MRRSNKELETEIKDLAFCKHCIPMFNAFNENNYALIDYQLRVLREELNGTSEGEFSVSQFKSLPEYIQEGLFLASRWIDGDSDESPSEGWAFYVVNRYYKKIK